MPCPKLTTSPVYLLCPFCLSHIGTGKEVSKGIGTKNQRDREIPHFPSQLRPMTVPSRHRGKETNIQSSSTTTMVPKGTAARLR